MLERSVVAYCAPTLAAMATGNLFTCPCDSLDALHEQVDQCNGCLNDRGVLLRVLREGNGTALVYVFRPKKLWNDLKLPGVMEFLEGCGYHRDSLCGLIGQLAQRVGENRAFPHEIGLFLGYPLDDVRGFIDNQGTNYKYAGYWKVYSDEEQARQLFQKFRLCTRLYGKRFLQGSTVQQLTVVA